MEHAAVMGLGERVSDLDPVPQRLSERERAGAETSRQGDALEMLHHEEIHSVFPAHVEHLADVRVTERRERV